MHQNTTNYRHHLPQRHPHLPITHDAGVYPEQSEPSNMVPVLRVVQKLCIACKGVSRKPRRLNTADAVWVHSEFGAFKWAGSGQC